MNYYIRDIKYNILEERDQILITDSKDLLFIKGFKSNQPNEKIKFSSQKKIFMFFENKNNYIKSKFVITKNIPTIIKNFIIDENEERMLNIIK